jgi:hypothetical protein
LDFTGQKVYAGIENPGDEGKRRKEATHRPG